jgi:VanZ family protein
LRPLVFVRAIAPLALMGLIFFLSAKESIHADMPEWMPALAHFIEYAALATLWTWALAPALGRQALLAAAVISLLYAVSDEYHQRFVDGRDSDILDVLTDAVGIAFALFVIDRVSRTAITSRRA